MNKLILLVLTLYAFNAKAGNDVGGGGMICISPKNCMTLAQAGLRIKEEPIDVSAPPAPAVSFEVIKKMQEIIKTLNIPSDLKSAFYRITQEPANIYKKVDFYDPKKFEIVKKEYNAILDENNFSTSNLIIAAISDKKSTYILPEFDRLNTYSQALVLIHEGVVRQSGSVKLALQIDGAILDASNGKPNMHQLTTLVAKAFDKFSFHHYTVATLIKEQVNVFNKKYKLSDELAAKMKSGMYGVDLNNDLFLMNELYSQFPELWNALKTANVSHLCSMYGNFSRFEYDTTHTYRKYEAALMDWHKIDRSDLTYCNNLPNGLYLGAAIEEQISHPHVVILECFNNKIDDVVTVSMAIGKSNVCTE
jgi:hypothetical protein